MRWLIIILFPVMTFGQKKIIPYVGMVTAGFLDGQAEILKFRYSSYKRVHPNTNPQWSDPSISWLNKYKDWPADKRERFPGSKTIFAWATDKYHMNRTLRNGLMCGSVSFNIALHEKPKLITIAKVAVLSWASYAAGTQIAYQIYR